MWPYPELATLDCPLLWMLGTQKLFPRPLRIAGAGNSGSGCGFCKTIE